MTQICQSGRTEWFLYRRIARVVPLYWGTTLLLFLISVIAPSVLIETRPNTAELLLSLLFIPYRKSAGQIEPFLFLGWTLNFEMYFYVLLSIGLLLWPKRAVWVAAALITGVFLCLAGRSGVYAFYYGNSMVFEFIAGAIVFYLYNAIGRERAWRLRFVFLAAAIVAMAAIPWPDFLFPITGYTRGIYLGGPAACLVAAVLGLARAGCDSPWRWIVLLGDASYVMYLIHPFVEKGLEKLVVLLLPSLSHYLIVMSSLLLGSVALVSVLIYQTVDLPIQHLLRFGKNSRTPQTSTVTVQ